MTTYLKKEGSLYIWTGRFDTKDTPKSAGFRWEPTLRYWWTGFIDNAAKLAHYATPELKAELDDYTAYKEKSIAQSRTLFSDADLPKPANLDYRPYQKAAIQYALQRDNVLFGDPMGLGKSMEAIGIINARKDIKSILVVCPATPKRNWKRELEKWLVRPLSVGIAYGDDVPDTDIVIINYDILKRNKDKLMARDWDLLIGDEIHHCKNSKTDRSKYLFGEDVKDKDTGLYSHTQGLADRAKYLAYLTGTLIRNRPIEAWSILHSLAPDVFPSFMGYAKRYCGAYQDTVPTRYGPKDVWVFSGASNLDEMQEKMRASVLIRREKSEVMPELPAKIRQIIELDDTVATRRAVNAEKKQQKAYNKQLVLLTELYAKIDKSLADKNEEEYRKAVANLEKVGEIAFQDMSRVRHDTAVAKIPQVIEHLGDVLEQVDKVIVFAHHHDVMDAIQDAFPDISVRLDGSTSNNRRDEVVEAFQSNTEIKLFIGQIQAAGEAITLTASSHVVFAELDWVPGNLTQAEDRVYGRANDPHGALIQHLVVPGSLDAKMAQMVVEKQDVIDKALDSKVGMPNIRELVGSIV